VRGVTVQRNFSPNAYLVIGEVENGTCVKVRMARDSQLHHHCVGTPFDVRFACDLPEGMHCLFNLRSSKDVVVSITQRR
jgi:hypothetical protein